MIKKQSFTLIEILISIFILFIIVLFLYQALDITQKSNIFFNNKVVLVQNISQFKTILTKDIANSSNNPIIKHKNNNIILKLKTLSYYHNQNFKNITYILSRENNLLRIESKDKFNQKNLNYTFFQNAYIDIVLKNVKTFNLIAKKQNIFTFYIKQKNNNDTIITTKSLIY